ncbi:MAG TPA: adenylate/guanylate cyclase domain-containing protein [Jiangellaceae bacterium]|nr:adenylate/guanylate cyclase domain-containing protein [Jiangellaceae bacterium]
MEAGQTGYARTSDGIHIAYRTWGEKSPVHVFLSDFGATVDTRDMHPSFLRLWRQLSGISKVVSLDRRGIGTSDVACPQRFDLDDYVLDILAVVDAIGAKEVVLTGEGSAGAGAVAFTVAHSDRVTRLAIVNGFASQVQREDYDIALFSRDDVIAMIDNFLPVWGQGEFIQTFAPKLAFDPSFVEVCGRIERFVCGPNTAAAWGRAVAELDIRDLAARVDVPTLVYFTGDLLHVAVEQCRDLADRIPNASLVEAPGRLFYQPDQSPQLDEFAEFIGGRIDPDPTVEATVLFVDVVGSTAHAAAMGDASWLEVLNDLDAFVQQQVSSRGGRVVKQTGDGHLAMFDDPSDGLSAAMMITKGVNALGIEARGGVHLGVVSLRSNGDVGGMAIHFAARLMNAAGARQVYVSEALAERVGSRSVRFEDRGEHEFKGVPGRHVVLEALGN